jgi:hypothetical protein
MLTTSWLLASPSVLVPLPLLSLMTLSVMSTATPPFVASALMPPPAFWVIVTWSKVALTLARNPEAASTLAPPRISLALNPGYFAAARDLRMTSAIRRAKRRRLFGP